MANKQTKKVKDKKNSGRCSHQSVKNADKKKIEDLEDLPLVGGLFRGVEKLVDLAERVEKAGGEIKEHGKIIGEKGKTVGIYGCSVKMGIGEKSVPKISARAKNAKKRKKGQA